MELLSTVRKTGSRGGVTFSWDDVSSSAHRENYLGHSLKAPVGRWAKGRDLNWYAKAGTTAAQEGETEAEKLARERRDEIRKIKEAEEEAIARALGLPITLRNTTGANAIQVDGAKVSDREAKAEDGDATTKDAAARDGKQGKRHGRRDIEHGHRRRHRSRARVRSRSVERRRDRSSGRRRSVEDARRRSRSRGRSRSPGRDRHRDGPIHRRRDRSVGYKNAGPARRRSRSRDVYRSSAEDRRR